ncbi:MAG: hypothetical protein C3F17_13920 [Bradyrhizobiaceae bacterium]|nr:MAG: hypothetical protein C3F17_13920 [Bradyrhizobiaceae bacterium]
MEPQVQRRRELRAALAEVDAQVEGLAKELREIDVALEAITTAASAPPARTPTIKEAVLQVLKERGRGLTSNEILDAINDRFFGGDMERTSLSPQLSRLKNEDKKVVLLGTQYFLAETKDGPASAEPSLLD